MLNKLVNQALKFMKPMLKYLDNALVMGTVSIFLVLYGALAKPELPNFLKNLMQNSIFRLLYIFLIAYTGDKNLVASIVIAFTFMVLFGLLSEVEIQESFENTDITNALEGQLDALLDELNVATEGSDAVKAPDAQEGQDAAE